MADGNSGRAADDCLAEARIRGTELTLRKAAELLDTLGRSNMVEQGEVLLISVEPVKLALGPKWEARQAAVLEHTERHFRKDLRQGAMWLPVTDTEVMIAAPGAPAAVTQGVCFRALKEVLAHFVGQFEAAAIRIERVCGVAPHQLQTVRVELSELQSAEESLPKAASARVTPPALTALHQLKSWPMTTMDGRDITVSFAVDPVVSLDRMALAGHRVEARLLDAATREELRSEYRRRLLAADVGRIDAAALERGIARLGTTTPKGPWLILQLSFVGLSNARTRRGLLDQASALRTQMRRGVICELVDLESGVPAGRLHEVASFVRPLCAAVFAQVEPNARSVETIKAAKLAGLTVRAADLGSTELEIADGMRRFAPLAMKAAAVSTVTSLPTSELLIEATACGFSHATLRRKLAGPDH